MVELFENIGSGAIWRGGLKFYQNDVLVVEY